MAEMAESGLTVTGGEPECLHNLGKGQVQRLSANAVPALARSLVGERLASSSDRANCPAVDHELVAVYCTSAIGRKISNQGRKPPPVVSAGASDPHMVGMPDHPSLTAPRVKLPPYRPVETMDPYKPCWCGSDRKYKWCHHRRHEAAQINVFEIERRMTAALQGGECSHPDPAAEPCKGPVVKSHTVQRKGGLSQIAEDSHVLTVKPAMKGLMESEGESWPRPVGINKASVFPGFCEKHDTALFKPVEGQTLPLDTDHAFLLAYRAIAYERFAKDRQVIATELQRDMDSGHPFMNQALVQQRLRDVLFGIRIGLDDIERTKAAFDSKLMTGDRTDFHFLAVRFGGLLPLVACTAFHVERDFDGNEWQRLGHGDAPFDLITLTITAFQGKTVAVLGWIGETDGPAARFAASLRRVPDLGKADALLRLAFVQTDNLFLRPSWWTALGEDDQKALVEMIMAGTPTRPRLDGALLDDGRRLLTVGVVEMISG